METPYWCRCSGCNPMSSAGGCLKHVHIQHLCHFQTICDIPRCGVHQCYCPWSVLQEMCEWQAAWPPLDCCVIAACYSLDVVQQHLLGWWCVGPAGLCPFLTSYLMVSLWCCLNFFRVYEWFYIPVTITVASLIYISSLSLSLFLFLSIFECIPGILNKIFQYIFNS